MPVKMPGLEKCQAHLAKSQPRGSLRIRKGRKVPSLDFQSEINCENSTLSKSLGTHAFPPES